MAQVLGTITLNEKTNAEEDSQQISLYQPDFDAVTQALVDGGHIYHCPNCTQSISTNSFHYAGRHNKASLAPILTDLRRQHWTADYIVPTNI